MFEHFYRHSAPCVYVHRVNGKRFRSPFEARTCALLYDRGYVSAGCVDTEPQGEILLFSALYGDMATMSDGSNMSRDEFWDWLDDQLGNAREHAASEPDPLDPENCVITVRATSDVKAGQPVGTKHDAGKPRASLLPGDALLRVAKVLTDGAAVHGTRNWQHVAPERYTDALARHVCKYLAGESHDAESGSPHMAHIAANALFLLHLNPDGVSL